MKHIEFPITILNNNKEEITVFNVILDMINNVIYVYDENKQLYSTMTVEIQFAAPPMEYDPNKIMYSYTTEVKGDDNIHYVYGEDHINFSSIINKMYHDTNNRLALLSEIKS